MPMTSSIGEGELALVLLKYAPIRDSQRMPQYGVVHEL